MSEKIEIKNSVDDQNSEIVSVEKEALSMSTVNTENSLMDDSRKEIRINTLNETDAFIPGQALDASSKTPAENSQAKEGDEVFLERDSRIRQLETELESIKKEHMQEMERSHGEIAELKVMSGIKDAAVKCGFIDPAEAALHLKDVFRVSAEGILFKGKRIKDCDLGKVIMAAVRNLSDARPHLIRFEFKSGSGALKNAVVVGRPVSRRDFTDPKTKREYEEELKRRGIQPLNPV